MARKSIRMEKIRDVIRYRMTTEMSERAIARALKVSRTAVTKYISCFLGSGLNLEEIKEMPDSELMRRLESSKEPVKSPRYQKLFSRFPMMAMELKRKGVRLHLLWQEYRKEYSQGYEYSQFCYHFQQWRNRRDVRMHIEHKAGDKMFVDYAGEKPVVTDPNSGKEREVEVFVAILGASELTYVEASESQKTDDWIRSNERALWYFDGVPAALVPDNLKPAVTKSDPYEPGINLLFDDFARHYGMVIVPARVAKARDKDHASNCTSLRVFVSSFGYT